MENLRKCKIVAEKEYKGAIYYKVATESGKEYIFKEKDNDVKLVDYNKYSKMFKTNKIIKNLFMPIILTTMITSSLSGCSKGEKETTNNKTNIETKDINNLPFNEYDSEYTKTIRVKDLKKYGIEYENLNDKCYLFGDAIDAYKIKNMDLSKLPMNEVFDYIPMSFDTRDIESLTLENNVTWDDVIDLVNKKEIGKKYKEIIISAIEKMKSLNLDKGLPIIYNNIKNSEFLVDKSIGVAEFSQYNHQLIIGDIFIKDNKKTLNIIKNEVETGEITKEEYEEIISQEQYMLPHELGHMISLYYDDTTTKSFDIETSYALVDPSDKSVIGIIPVGRCLSDGFADYLTYEITGRKTSKAYGYPIGQCAYLAYKGMLGIDNIEDLRTLSTEKLCSELKNIGMNYAFDSIMTFDEIVRKDYELMSNPYTQYDDFTYLITSLFSQYVTAQTNNGVEMEKIINVLKGIVQSYKDRIGANLINGELIIEATAGYSTVSITKIEEYINNLSNIKVYKK